MLLIALSLVGCSDYDNGFTDKQIAYEKQFTDIFGQIDPNQDWSMAAYVSAKVTVANAGQGSTVEIYTDVPAYATTKFLTRATIKDSDISFNVVKGTEQVYAVVRNNGKVLVQGFYDIQNEAINITDKPVAKRAAKMLETRFGDGSNVKIGDTDAVDKDGGAYKLEATLLKQGYSYNGQVFTEEELREWAKNNLVAEHHDPFNDDCVIPAHLDFTNAIINENRIETVSENQYKFKWGGYTEEIYTWDELVEITKEEITKDPNSVYTAPLTNCWIEASVDFTNATIDTEKAPLTGLKKAIEFTHLVGVEREAAEPWHLALGYELFGPNTFFEEQEKYYGQKKRELYGSTEEEQLQIMQKIETGFSIVTDGGEIDIPFIYGATRLTNQFGYVYYQSGQDPLDQPHYILMDDATPSGNIYFTEWNNRDNAVEGMQLSEWTDIDDKPLNGYSEDTYVYGTKYRLSFFGENHDEIGTYNFPAGYHIVFFVKTEASSNFTYSQPVLNERIGHLYKEYNGNGETLTYLNGVAPNGAVKSTAWRTNGMTFLGFEDGGGDDDLNDIVFWVDGDYTTETDIPDVWVEDEIDPETWIFACEDLGGSFDYDFNDVVWEAVQTFDGDDQSGWTINLLAAGGTLPVELWYGEEQLCEDVHQVFGQQSVNGSYTPINVGETATEAPVKVGEIILEEPDINKISENFKVKVNNNNEQSHYIKFPTRDNSKAPQIIILPKEWLWPRENVLISDAYNGFAHWVEDSHWSRWISNAPNYKAYTTQRYQQ